MTVIREDQELLAELARLNKQLVTFAWRLMEARLAAAEHYEVASWLVDLAEAIQARGQRQDAGVVEGEIVEDSSDSSGNAASHREQ